MTQANQGKPSRPKLLPLKPIIAPSTNSPRHVSFSASSGLPSANTSPSMSRRSSSTGSQFSVTGKCVHFPIQNISTYHLTHSRDQYDRSPIIPSGEDLDIPSCKREEGSWIKCLQRKAKQAAKDGQPPPFTYTPPPTSAAACAESDTEGVISPGSEMSLPSLTDDYSSSSESEAGPISATSSTFSARPTHYKSSSLEMFMTMSHDKEPSWDSHRLDDDPMLDNDCEEEDDEDEAAVLDQDAAEIRSRKPGMCSLGKFSRQSLFQHDAFGGF